MGSTTSAHADQETDEHNWLPVDGANGETDEWFLVDGGDVHHSID